MKNYTTRTTCRICGSSKLVPLLSLGDQYVSDFVTKDKITAGPRVPIDIELCEECTLVQAKHTAPQDFLYSRYYWYRSGTTDTMRAALADVVESAEKLVNLEDADVVLDIGSNDGTLLRCYQNKWLHTVGVEPAINLREVGSAGIKQFVNDFWDENSRRTIFQCDDKAKVITALGMFYDLEDPNDFIRQIAECLHPEGVFIAQLMCLKNMLEIGDVGNFAHEHLEFYSLRSLIYLYEKHGLEIFDVQTNNVNGQSYRIYARLRRSHYPLPEGCTDRFWQACRLESQLQLNTKEPYKAFMGHIDIQRLLTWHQISHVIERGQKVWVYGASTKGNVILQYYGLDSSMITGAADVAPDKCGKYTVGTGIPIYSLDDARKRNPDYFLVLPYAFLPEFMEREKEQTWRKRGGRFIVPLPTFNIL